MSSFDFSQPRRRKLKQSVTSGVRKKLEDSLPHIPSPGAPGQSLALALLKVSVFTWIIIEYFKKVLSVNELDCSPPETPPEKLICLKH